MSNHIPPPYPEEQRWYSQPRAGYPANYPDREGYGSPPQPQVGYPGQAPASPYPGGQGMYPQQQGYAGNNPYAGNGGLYASNNLYAVPLAPPGGYQPPAAPFTPPVPGVYEPYGMVDPNKGKATAGLVLGIVTTVAFILELIPGIFLPALLLLFLVVALICGILGIIFSVPGRRSTTQKGIATTGLILSVIGIILAFLLFIFLIILGAIAAANS